MVNCPAAVGSPNSTATLAPLGRSGGAGPHLRFLALITIGSSVAGAAEAIVQIANVTTPARVRANRSCGAFMANSSAMLDRHPARAGVKPQSYRTEHDRAIYHSQHYRGPVRLHSRAPRPSTS